MSASESPFAITELFQQARSADGAARQALHDDLVLRHLDLAQSVARSYARTGEDTSDLTQVACMGLIKAVRGFDPERGYTFAAYAMPTVSGEVKRYLRDHSWVIRPPRHLQDLRTVLSAARPRLAQQLGREPSIPEMAVHLGHTESDVEEALNCQGSLRPESLDAPAASAEGRLLTETLGRTDSNLERAEELLTLRSLISDLTPREKEVLYRRYFDEQTQQQIADEVGLTQMQVSRMLARLLSQLRRRLLDQGAPMTSRKANGARPRLSGPALERMTLAGKPRNRTQDVAC